MWRRVHVNAGHRSGLCWLSNLSPLSSKFTLSACVEKINVVLHTSFPSWHGVRLSQKRAQKTHSGRNSFAAGSPGYAAGRLPRQDQLRHAAPAYTAASSTRQRAASPGIASHPIPAQGVYSETLPHKPLSQHPRAGVANFILKG